MTPITEYLDLVPITIAWLKHAYDECLPLSSLVLKATDTLEHQAKKVSMNYETHACRVVLFG